MQSRTIAVIGGTGKEGFGLALRWAHAGHRVLIGSRVAQRAREAATTINGRVGRQRAEGADNLAAAQGAEIAVLTVPYPAQLATLDGIKAALAGKILSTPRCHSSRRRSAACNCRNAARPSSTRRKYSAKECV